MVSELLALRWENLGYRRTFLKQQDEALRQEQQILLGEMRKQAGVSPQAVYDANLRLFREPAPQPTMQPATVTAFPMRADA